MGTVYVLLQDQNTLWIGAERGLFRWDNPSQGGNPQLIPNSPQPVKKLHKFGARLLIGGMKGLFVWQDAMPAGLTHFDVAGDYVNAFYLDPSDNNKLWIGAQKGLLSWNSADKEPVLTVVGENAEVTSIYKENGLLLVGTSQGLLRWVDALTGSPQPVFNDIGVYSLYRDVSTLLVSTEGNGLRRLDNIPSGHADSIDSEIGTSSKYLRTESILWMGAGIVAEAGLYQWNSQKEKKPKRIDKINTGSIHCFYKSGGTLLIGAQNGLFRIEGLDTDWDAKLQIVSKPPDVINTDTSWPIQWQVGNFGWRTTPAQVQYRAMIKGEDGLEKPIIFNSSNNGVLLTSGVISPLPAGKYNLYIEATDLNDKTARSQTIHFHVAASKKSIVWFGIMAAIGYGFLIVFAIIRAPYGDYCQRLLMNPWLRRLGSFGLIPLALTLIPPFRRRILKRYSQGIKNDPEFSAWRTSFVLPAEDFLPNRFGKLLADKRKLLLLGQSGIGKTSYFQYLIGHYAQSIKTPPDRAIPVFLPLASYRGTTPKDIFNVQLAKYGLLTDRELNNWFLEEGGFVIFIDGLNEVDTSTRDQINTFVNQYWKANYFCISSQQPYPEFRGIERVQLATLSEDKIKEFLQQRLKAEQAEAIIKQFNGNISEIYKIPQDLEFAVEFKKSNPEAPIPYSLIELYDATLSPVLRSWEESGHGDYPEQLCQTAYEMLRSHESIFDKAGTLPGELKHRLVEMRYLTQDSDNYLFRHDLIRSYLASKYFSEHWRDLILNTELSVDFNWRRMLEFFLLNLKRPEEASAVLNWMLDKNKRLARELFSWMEVKTPGLCTEWVTNFKIKFADAMLTSP
jgi:hypothetical protein